MGNAKPKKYDENNPDIKAVRRYEKEIASLQEKYDEANKSHDWSMRHFYYNQIQAKTTNMNILLDKLKKRMLVVDR